MRFLIIKLDKTTFHAVTLHITLDRLLCVTDTNAEISIALRDVFAIEIVDVRQ